jgi:diguanylate cyclase (GGDEF)-like protein/PAS domain S-box-containing protein
MRPVRVLIAAALLLAALLAVFSSLLLGFQHGATREVSSRFAERASLSASLTDGIFGSSAASSQVENAKRFGASPIPAKRTLTAWARRNRSQTVVILDGTGKVLAASAGTSPALTHVLEARPAYVRQVLARQPFALSNVTRFDGGAPVIEFAQRFVTPYGRRVIVTGFAPGLLYSFFGGYLRSVPNPHGNGYMLDANGVVVGGTAHDAKPGQPVSEPGLLAALRRGRQGTFGATYFARRSVGRTGWQVVLSAPKARVFASVTGSRKWLPWIIVWSFVMAGGVALVLLWRSMRNAAALQLSHERYALVVRGANDGIWDRDLLTDDLYVSPRWNEILGLPPDSQQSEDRWLSRVHPEDRPDLDAEFSAYLAGGTETFEHEHRTMHGDGEWRWTLARGVATRDADGRALRMAGSMTDTTLVHLAHEQLRQDALHDALTGLANRTLFLDRLTLSLARSVRDHTRRSAVLFLDLDRFKLINDSFSHSVGDELLVELGRRLTDVLRPGDTVARGGPEDTIARLGGDEFTILLDDVNSRDDAVAVTERVLLALQQPFLLGNRPLSISASVGIALSDVDITPAEMMRNADLAMYEAKRMGKARWALYTAALHEQVTQRLQVELTLRTAIEDETLRVFYQPVIDLQTGAVRGFEALARWPEHLPVVTPDEFIPVAEESGLIDGLWRLVLSRSCARMQDWRENGRVGSGATISVNLAGSQLNDPDTLLADVAAVLRETGLPAAALVLEITEGTIISEPEQVKATLDRLGQIGVRAHIDDFGTGYSSLSFLHHFPGEALKIDRSFVSSLHQDTSHYAIVRAIVSLARSLGLKTIAEGLDAPEQIALLRELGCDHGQGFLFARPLPGDDVEEFLAEWDCESVLALATPGGAAPILAS